VSRALALVVIAACGGSDSGSPPPPKAGGTAAQPGARAPGKPGAKKDDKDKLQVRRHAEDNVPCPVNDGEGKGSDGTTFFYGTGPDCKPEAPTCAPGLYCVEARNKQNQAGNKCEPCRERDAIRHDFKDRDFLVEQSRDPFQSFVIVRPELGKPSEPTRMATGSCTQLRATTYSYQDLRLVGLVSRGTVKTALMMNSRNVGEFIHRGECVGKEKALVSDIVLDGETACVHFQVTAEQSEKASRIASREVPPMCLHPNGMGEPESQPPLPGDSVPPGTPQVAPPPGTQVAPPP
jgi:hypothetical protein